MSLNHKKRRRIRNPRLRVLIALAAVLIVLGIGYLGVKLISGSRGKKAQELAAESQTLEIIPLTEVTEAEESGTEVIVFEITEAEETETTEEEAAAAGTGEVTSETISWNSSWDYASYSKVHDSSVTLYHSGAADRNGYVIGINAGHGSRAAQQVSTQCHPDGSAKVTGGSTSEGATTATGANSGTTLADGTSEASANLAAALVIKEILLENGYDVLMIREAEDCSLDNIARTVYANNNADCHIAIHYDSTESNKGLFCINVPDNSSYRSMEPVASHYQQHNAICQALVQGEEAAGVKIYSDGLMALDLTQTSYSTVPSVDMEIGDKETAHNTDYYQQVANGIVKGLDIYFGVSR